MPTGQIIDKLLLLDMQNEYNKFHFRPGKEYAGKHEKKWYNVYRVVGPAGPEEQFQVYGIDEARKTVQGCWDYEITAANARSLCKTDRER